MSGYVKKILFLQKPIVDYNKICLLSNTELVPLKIEHESAIENSWEKKEGNAFVPPCGSCGHNEFKWLARENSTEETYFRVMRLWTKIPHFDEIAPKVGISMALLTTV